MSQKLIAHIKRFVPLTDEEEKILKDYVQTEKYGKKEHLLDAGEVCSKKYFVANGILRMYNLNEKGVEQVIHFAIEGWWVTDYFSYNSGKPSKVSLQAVEEAEVAVIDASLENELLAKVPKLESYFRQVLERAYAASLMRTHYMFNFSAEDRYRHFAATYPDFVQRVPQYLLASYLGFTPEFLSKVRAKKE
ncbi:Crp/Fnr family transcriptional regulator [Flavobacterium alkalisoli]|uniref:Crp/Fnr family transcriptional regulator n=1 Tax=Flavobacterium alkalisoli TaxID=2602769 RepID=A0A5B9FM46_9FLAO|nr:Crp/Fnr family transcriptional regulator [Flavobacterium alkalisoli]QEE48313.1 Crp/Fnr family transcriptional regulator [Flavobacterium alkalisoli]